MGWGGVPLAESVKIAGQFGDSWQSRVVSKRICPERGWQGVCNRGGISVETTTVIHWPLVFSKRGVMRMIEDGREFEQERGHDEPWPSIWMSCRYKWKIITTAGGITMQRYIWGELCANRGRPSGEYTQHSSGCCKLNSTIDKGEQWWWRFSALWAINNSISNFRKPFCRIGGLAAFNNELMI